MDDTDLPDFANMLTGKLFSIESKSITKEYKETFFRYNIETEEISLIDDIKLLTKINEKEIICAVTYDDVGKHVFQGIYVWLYVKLYNSLRFLKLKKIDSFDYKYQSPSEEIRKAVVYFVLSPELSILAKLDPRFVDYIELNNKLSKILNKKKERNIISRLLKKPTKEAPFIISHTAFFVSEERNEIVPEITGVDYHDINKLVEI